MKEYLLQFIEMAQPRKVDTSKRYYHGSINVKDANSIMKEGIKPPDLSTKKKNVWTPREGKSYITSDLKTAVAYAVGGATQIGTEQDYKKGQRFGFLFVVDGKDMVDIEPDEDSVGMILNDLLDKIHYGKIRTGKEHKITPIEQSILDTASKALTPWMLQKAKSFDSYHQLTMIGKKLLKSLSEEQMFWFISKGAHIAHAGTIKPIEAWKIDFHDIEKIKSNCSNFFQIAKKIKGQ